MSQLEMPNAVGNQEGNHVAWFADSLSLLDEGIAGIGQHTTHADRIRIVVGESGTLKSRIAYAFLANGMKGHSPDSKCGAVLLTSESLNKDDLISAIKEWNGNNIIPEMDPLESRVLVNPISSRFLSSSNFVFLLKLSIRSIKKKLNIDDKDAFRIRVVIDNWNTIIDAHSSLQKDDQLLQAVLTVLREEGVLAMIVSTQPGSPAAISGFSRKHDLTRIEATRIHCWPVDFFGDRRVAITTSIPGKDGMRTTVAEICRYNGHGYKIVIKEDFDFYEDLESGKAKRVKLKVKLYSGYDDSGDNLVPASSNYGGEVSALFGDLFSRTESKDDVVTFESTSSYDSFKEYIQNLDRGQLDETLVFQVDEFWIRKEQHSSFAKIRYQFFKEHEIELDRRSFPDSIFGKPENDFFRVPLHIDFGLMLADRAAWYRAKELKIDNYILPKKNDFTFCTMSSRTLAEDYDFPSMPIREYSADGLSLEEAAKFDELRVGHIWNAMCVDGASFEGFHIQGKSFFVPSWQLFLRACEIVALNSGKRPFDVDLRTSESLSSLVLEIWITRIVDNEFRGLGDSRSLREICEKTLQDENKERYSLRQLVEKYKDEFIFALRTAIRFLPGRYREQKLSLAPPDIDAVAIRTWFAGSVHCQLRNPNLTPLRVPGRFSIRGDWYLAVAKGSRSMRLAENAMAKLLSKSMNRKRLREGIGLPILETTKQDNLDNVETALKVPDPNLSSYRPLRLRELKNAAPKPFPVEEDSNDPVKLVRFFRSEIKEYDATSEQFQLLIATLLRRLEPIETLELIRLEQTDNGVTSGSSGAVDAEVAVAINDFIG